MAGHSNWKTIQHRLGRRDAKTGEVFSRLANEIMVAVKAGGGPDLDVNSRLRLAVQNAKAQNMTDDIIEPAINKTTGAGGDDIESHHGLVSIQSAMEGFGAVQKKLAELDVERQEGGPERIPTTTKEVSAADTFGTFMKLIGLIEDDDDVQKVYHNVEYSEELRSPFE